MLDIKKQVKEYIFDNFIMGSSSVEISGDTSFLGVGIIDSTGVLELISFLEETFRIEVGDEEMIPENLDSLNQIEKFVTKKLTAGQVAGGAM
jgi:acyl carrier protein